ncbi:DUF6233 domain-containing protein [Streptomyces pseudogriseolus]|uniref:DUF6233 domain-containing protein n=1 Tax=Streptomyces pseudogriseolus TaxID=36817 RepID=UPI003FA1CB79
MRVLGSGSPRRSVGSRSGSAAGRPGRRPPHWLLERGLNSRAPVYVHVGGCWNARHRADGVSREQALRALAEGLPACSHCRPDTELGYVDG